MTNISLQFFAKTLKKMRENAGYSMDTFCKLFNEQYNANLNKSTVSRYENMTQEPMLSTAKNIADFFGVSPSALLGYEEEESPYILHNVVPMPKGGVRIPILGKVIAGQPTEAIEDILGYIEITPEQAMNGVHFALQIKGDSMLPELKEGDIVIVQKDFVLHDKDIVILSINGDESTCKQVFKKETGLMIQAFNSAVFPSQFYTNEEIDLLPISILGKVVELKRIF